LWQRSPANQSDHLVIAHYNHALRGEASAGDQRFVVDLANSLGLICHTESAVIDTTSPPARGGEAMFRSLRYRYLQATAEKIGARYVLVAHTADDNVETMLHHLFRGSGTRGLTGIAPHRSLGPDLVLLRPMLTIRREELRRGLREIGQLWREDASNADDRFQRNWIRGTLLPTIRNRYPAADEAILRVIANQSQIQSQLEQQAGEWMERFVVRDGEKLVLRRGPIQLTVVAEVVRRLWQQMDWPRQSLSAVHHRRLHSALTELSDESFTLPAGIQCRPNASQVELDRT
jgi:tRNA(Ile)-lysidine synthase